MDITIWLIISTQFKILHLWWYWGAFISMGLAACICRKAPLAPKVYTGFRRTYSPIQMRSFSWKAWHILLSKFSSKQYFSKPVLKRHTVCHTAAWLCSRSLAAELAWLLSRPFNYWVHHETQKFKIWEARILYQTRVSLPKVQQLASLPKHLWTVIHSGKRGPVTILTRLPSHSKWNTQISKFKTFDVFSVFCYE